LPPCSTPLPYTTLFRSYVSENAHTSILAEFVEPLVHEEFRAKFGDEPLYEVHHVGVVDHSSQIADLEASRERVINAVAKIDGPRSEEHTSELQSRENIV